MKNIALLILFLAVIATVSSFLLPANSSFRSPLVLHLLWAVSIFMSVMYLAAAFFTITTPAGALKPKINFLALGFVLLAVGQLQNPLNDLFNLWDSGWVKFGGYNLPFVLADACLLMGLIKTGNFFKVSVKKLLFPSFIFGVLVVVVLIFIPHTPLYGAQKMWGFLERSILFDGILIAIAAILTLFSAQIRSKLINTEQKFIFTLLMLANICLFIGNLEILIFDMTSYQNFLFNSGLYNIPYIFAGIFYAFYALEQNEYFHLPQASAGNPQPNALT